jgi:hypothetical protein
MLRRGRRGHVPCMCTSPRRLNSADGTRPSA